MRVFRAVGLTLLLSVAIYAPASALAIGLHLQLATTVPFVMLFTFFTAAFLILLMASRTREGLARYGISVPTMKQVGAAVIVSAPVAIVTALLLTRAHERGPLADLSLGPWLIVLYFVVGAPIQEEVIFRGPSPDNSGNRCSASEGG